MTTASRRDEVERLAAMARRMRLKALEMALGAGRNGAHLGPAFSCMEILAALYGAVLRRDASEPAWPGRDRFLASKGHCVLALYTALVEAGLLEAEALSGFEKNDGGLHGHPPLDVGHGFEFGSGSLGMALGVGLGMALDARRRGRDNRVFVLLGDGELDEGSNWEAFMAASHFRAENLVAIVDRNVLQYDGPTEEVLALGDLAGKLGAFGWDVAEIDGHDFDALLGALAPESGSPGRPRAVVAKTVKGKGVSFMENVREWHHGVLSQKQYDQAVAEVKGTA